MTSNKKSLKTKVGGKTQLETVETGVVSNTTPSIPRSIQRKYWSFTYPYKYETDGGDQHYHFDDIKKMMETLGSESYIFQREKGITGYEHYQGSITLKGKGKRLEEIKKVMGKAHLEPSKSVAADAYAGKTETRIAGPWFYPYRYLGEDLPQQHELYEWQKKLLSELDGPVVPRKIRWYVDTVGNTGKSTFTKYLVYHRKAMTCGGELKDIAFAVSQMKPQEKPIFIFDLCRAQGNRLSYASLESLANGLFFSPKYESTQYIGPRPHIVIFSNFHPDETKLSEDRWDIRTLSNPPATALASSAMAPGTALE